MNNSEEERSIPNPAHYLGSLLMARDESVAATLSVFLALATPFVVHDLNEYNPPFDTEGTSMEASVMSDHRQAFSDLKEARIMLDSAIATNATYSDIGLLSEAKKESVMRLVDNFSEQAREVTLDLYLQNIVTTDTADNKAGAAISEVNFNSLHSELLELTDGYENIQDNLGISKKIAPEVLDECIIDTKFIQSGEEIDRYQDMTNLNKCMNGMAKDIQFDELINITTSIASALPGFILGCLVFGIGGRTLENTPERIKLKPKRKTNKW